MIRKTFFWLHLSFGVAAGFFIFIMAASGVVLAFQRQAIDFVDRDLRTVSVPNDAQRRSLDELLESVRGAGMGEPTAIAVRNQAQAATQFSIERNKTVYVDPYSGVVLGTSSAVAHNFFFEIERLHRALGAPLGSKNFGHWLTAISNLLFGALIALGLILWLPRTWNWRTLRGSIAFRRGLRARAREWNWHNVLGIWCALPLFVIVVTGVVMSFDWANTLLFRLTGSPPPASRAEGGERRPHGRVASSTGRSPSEHTDYEHLFAILKSLNADWRTITLSLPLEGAGAVTATIDTGTGGQPQKRNQYILEPASGAVLKAITFADGSLGQRLRAFVRFGHTGEWGGWPGQSIAAVSSLGACVLVYTGLSLAIRRLIGTVRPRRRMVSPREICEEHSPV